MGTADVQFEFTSPSYPRALANRTSQCDLTVSHDCTKPVCQLRLDLLDFELGPPTAGDCNDDQFIVRANDPLPTLCGDNTGQHMYVDVRGRSETNLNILSMPIFPKPVGVHNETDSSRTIIHWLNEVDPDRKWKMLVTQLPCDCSVSSLSVPKAPTGCLQFYTGIKGEVKSFNYEGTVRNYERRLWLTVFSSSRAASMASSGVPHSIVVGLATSWKTTLPPRLVWYSISFTPWARSSPDSVLK